MGILNDGNDLQNEMTEKAVRSIMRRSNWVNRVVSIDAGKAFEVSFNYNDFRRLHIKHFKGLFYAKYGFPIPDDYEIEIIAEGDETNENLVNIAKFLYGYNEDIPWQSIGHDNMFKYRMKSMTADKQGMIYEDADISNAVGFVCVMNYMDGYLKPLVIASKKKFIDE